MSKPNLENISANLPLFGDSRQLEQTIALYEGSKIANEGLCQRNASLESDCRHLEKSRDDDKARIDALEFELASLRAAKSGVEVEARWLEEELRTIKGAPLFRAMRPLGYLTRRLRKLFRLLARFKYAMFRFGPAEAVRRTRTYLSYRKVLGRTPASLAIRATAGVSSSRHAPVPAITGARDGAPWAMYVGDFCDGGLEKVVLDLAVQLSARGKSCSIIVKGKSGRAGDAARNLGINVVEFNGDAAGIRQFILDHQIVRVITHHCYDYLEDIAQTNVVIDEVIHNAYHWQRGNVRLSRIRHQFIENCISVSEFVNSYAIKELKINPSKLRVIHNGLAREGLIRPPVELMKQRRLESLVNPVFVMLANVHLQKNHLAVLHAVKEIKAKFPNVTLYMCGVIDDSTDLGRIIRATARKLDLSDTVEFTGSLDREGISRLLSRAHIALLPTSLEGFSIASLEYCYFGLPMVLSNTGASQTFSSAYDSVVLADDVALPARQLDSTRIERSGMFPDKRCIAGIVAAMEGVLSNYPHYLEQAELAANDWQSYAIETTVDRYLQLESEQWLAA